MQFFRSRKFRIFKFFSSYKDLFFLIWFEFCLHKFFEKLHLMWIDTLVRSEITTRTNSRYRRLGDRAYVGLIRSGSPRELYTYTHVHMHRPRVRLALADHLRHREIFVA